MVTMGCYMAVWFFTNFRNRVLLFGTVHCCCCCDAPNKRVPHTLLQPGTSTRRKRWNLLTAKSSKVELLRKIVFKLHGKVFRKRGRNLWPKGAKCDTQIGINYSIGTFLGVQARSWTRVRGDGKEWVLLKIKLLLDIIQVFLTWDVLASLGIVGRIKWIDNQM